MECKMLKSIKWLLAVCGDAYNVGVALIYVGLDLESFFEVKFTLGIDTQGNKFLKGEVGGTAFFLDGVLNQHYAVFKWLLLHNS